MRKHLNYANVAATLALFFAISGGALAANHYLINSTKQINPQILKKLTGKAGKAGATGVTGATGATGVAGRDGAPGRDGLGGKDGAKGSSGLIASNSAKYAECTLASGNTFCFEATTAFTPTAELKCVVSLTGQISGLTSGKPTTSGPYFRLAIKEGATEKNDGLHGFYFVGTTGTYSTPQERTRIITVQPGTTYTFGAWYGSAEGEWIGKEAEYFVTYHCFGT